MKKMMLVLGIWILSQNICKLNAVDNVSESKSFKADLNSADPKERNFAVNLIEQEKDRKRLRDIRKLAKDDPDPTVRHNAIGVMTRMRDIEAKQQLIEIASTASEDGDREVAVSAFPLLLSKEEAAPILKHALTDKDEVVRIRAAGNLGKYGDSAGEQIILKASQSKDQLIWIETMRAAGYVNTLAVKKRLEQLAAGNYRGHYEAKEAFRRLQYADASLNQQYVMAKEDTSSKYRGVVYLGCEKLADLGTPEAITYLYSLANDLNHYDSFRAARDVFVSRNIIEKKNYWDKQLTPK